MKSFKEIREIDIDNLINMSEADQLAHIDTLSEEQIDELIGKLVKGTAKLAGKAAKAGGKLAFKGAKAGVKRLTPQGRADAANKKANKIERQRKAKDNLKKAKERLAKAKASKKDS
jgi:hypothetical protein|tara:strand:+ start:1775 stop:2122 length:348 start_codon:yes stop_codon:yes gene_type:complete